MKRIKLTSKRLARVRCAAYVMATTVASVVSAQTATTSPTTTPTLTTATAPATRPASVDARSFLLTPIAPAADALRDRLRVDVADQIDGNAAPMYVQAMLMMPTRDQLDAVYDVTSEAKSDAEFLTLIAQRASWLDTSLPPLMETATLRESCDWELPIRHDNIRVLLPHLNHLRAMTNLLAGKFRLAMAQGDRAQAMKLLQAAGTMAERADDGATFLVNTLVSVGMEAAVLEHMVKPLMEAPDGANLYWSLRQLPMPFGNLRQAMDTERLMLINAFPVLRKARNGNAITADDWRQFAQEMRTYQSQAAVPGAPNQPKDLLTNMAAGAIAIAMIGPARAYYAKTRGVKEAEVAKLEPLRLVAIYYLESYQQAADTMYKWFALPYPQMLPGLKRASSDLTLLRIEQPMNLFLTLSPALARTGMSNAQVDRTIAAFATIEALRGYAATHNGQWPATLDAIIDTPVPLNPVDGQPFDYTVNTNGSATLGDSGELVERPMRYELRLRK